MNENFSNIETSLNQISKSFNGYSIYRRNSKNKYIIYFNLIENKIEIKKSI